MLAYQLPAYRKGKNRKAVTTAKFYFFDVGVANTLLRRGPVEPRSESFGRALEHLVFLELRAFLDHQRLPLDLSYWRTHTGHEVDFLVGEALAVEVKTTSRVDDRDLRSLRALAAVVSTERRLVVSTEAMSRRTDDGIEILPVAEFFRRLWAGELIA